MQHQRSLVLVDAIKMCYLIVLAYRHHADVIHQSGLGQVFVLYGSNQYPWVLVRREEDSTITFWLNKNKQQPVSLEAHILEAQTVTA